MCGIRLAARIGLLLSAGASLGLLAASGARAQSADGIHFVDVEGYAVRVQTSGLNTREEDRPVVVFEGGATNALEVWRGILTRVAATNPVVAYDRAGLGQSEWDHAAPTPRHVSKRLRVLLDKVGAEPPYILVGYSWGGVLVRYFAGYYPQDVAGIVFVDPGPIVTQSLGDVLAPFEAVGAGREEYDAYWTDFMRLFSRSPPAVRAEFDVLRRLMEVDPAERDVRAVPDVPVVVIVAAKYLDLPMLKLPYDPRAHFEADVRHRIRMLQEWALASPRGTLVVSNHTTHAVPREDPDLIVWAIARVLGR